MGRHKPCGRITRWWADQHFAKAIDKAFAGPLERILQRHPASAVRTGDLDFAAERQQPDRAVACGQGVGNVAGERADVAHLRAADNTATLGQAGAVAQDIRVANDCAVGDATADDDVVLFPGDAVQPLDVCHVDHGLYGPVQATARFDQQVGTAADDARFAVVALQNRDSLVDRLRRVVVLPALRRSGGHVAY